MAPAVVVVRRSRKRVTMVHDSSRRPRGQARVGTGLLFASLMISVACGGGAPGVHRSDQPVVASLQIQHAQVSDSLDEMFVSGALSGVDELGQIDLRLSATVYVSVPEESLQGRSFVREWDACGDCLGTLPEERHQSSFLLHFRLPLSRVPGREACLEHGGCVLLVSVFLRVDSVDGEIAAVEAHQPVAVTSPELAGSERSESRSGRGETPSLK